MAKKELREIPRATSLDQITRSVNDRFRDFTQDASSFVQNPHDAESQGNLDVSNVRVVNVADPKDDLDAVNLRTLRDRIGGAAQQPLPDVTKPTDTLTQAYLAVFTKDGKVANGELSPTFTVHMLREGLIQQVSVTADAAPLTESLLVDFYISIPGGVTHARLMTDPVELKVGEGSKFSTAINVKDRLVEGSTLQMWIIASGDAEKVVGEILVKRT